MDRSDALGPTQGRLQSLGGELLAETSDTELEGLVREAAEELSAPIALVSLILDHIQFFKAHYGLPAPLAAARGTNRDVSFCQFVVRDGVRLEVNDARGDTQLPQHLVEEYGVRSYIGEPLRVGDIVIGTLCVLDTEPRAFSITDRDKLGKLARRVNARITELIASRRRQRLELADALTARAVDEIRRALVPVVDGVSTLFSSVAAIRSTLRFYEHVLDGSPTSVDAMRMSLRSALDALRLSEELLHELSSAATGAEDRVTALALLVEPAASTRLSDTLLAAQDLVSRSLDPIGGVELPDLHFDPELVTRRPLAVALVANALAACAGSIDPASIGAGLRIEVEKRREEIRVRIVGGRLEDGRAAAVVDSLQAAVADEPSVTLGVDEGVMLSFATAVSAANDRK